MSVATTLYLHASRAPSAHAWLDAIRAAGFDVAFETDFTLDEDCIEGFLPVVLDGEEAGFELYFEPIDDLEERVRAAIGDRDASLAFVTHSDLRGLKTAVIAFSVLAEMTGGVLHDESSDKLIASEDAMANGHALLAEIGRLD